MHMFCHLALKSCTYYFAPLSRPKRKQNSNGSFSKNKHTRKMDRPIASDWSETLMTSAARLGLTHLSYSPYSGWSLSI